MLQRISHTAERMRTREFLSMERRASRRRSIKHKLVSGDKRINTTTRYRLCLASWRRLGRSPPGSNQNVLVRYSSRLISGSNGLRYIQRFCVASLRRFCTCYLWWRGKWDSSRWDPLYIWMLG